MVVGKAGLTKKYSIKVTECDLFFGKNVCISSHFQKKRFNEFLAIIERLYSYGSTYTGKASVCDIFIKYQDGEEEEIRFASIKQAEEKEKFVNITNSLMQ